MTVEQAIEAGARAQYDPAAGTSHEYRVGTTDWVSYCTCGWRGSTSYAVGEYDAHVSRLVLAAAWPILSGRLRELHERIGDPKYAGCCATCLNEYGESMDWPCPTMQKLHETDEELGLC